MYPALWISLWEITVGPQSMNRMACCQATIGAYDY